MYSTETEQKDEKLTITSLAKMKAKGEKIACVTAYDASFAKLIDQAGIELVLVGDSLGMVIQGHDSTVPVTMEDMIYHSQWVKRGLSRAFLLADLPFMSYTTAQQALENAARLLQLGMAQGVKLEGGEVQVEAVKRLSDHGIPCCAHLGLKPQSIHKLGGYRVQGRAKEAAQAMLYDAELLQSAGADLILLECVPAVLAAEITSNVDVPVIGIGAGSACDAQILVLYDMLGITPGHKPRFSKNFLETSNSIAEALQAYVRAVKDGSFPADEQSFI